MTLKSHKYNSEVRLYYQDHLSEVLAEAIISHLWSARPPAAAITFELVKAERTKVFKMNFQNKCYYLKCYSPENTSKIIKNFFRPADAVRYFQLSYHLQQAGVPVAPPVLALTKKSGLRPADSILVTNEIPGTDLHSYLMQKSAGHDEQLRKEIVKQFAFMWSRLIRLKLVHQDCWLGNFIVDPAAKKEDIRVYLLDVDNIYPRPLLPRKILWFMNVNRLKYKLERVHFPVTQAEKDLFLRELDRLMGSM